MIKIRKNDQKKRKKKRKWNKNIKFLKKLSKNELRIIKFRKND